MNILINPIEDKIQGAINLASDISIAVPFLSYSTVGKLFKATILKKIDNKRIVIKLDDSHSISYDLAAVKHLLNCGFEVRFDNSIHLKLYIFGERVFITSANLTNGGLKNNFELTVETTGKESGVESIFGELWIRNSSNCVTLDYVKQNWDKHLFLKRKYPRVKSVIPVVREVILSPDEETLVNAVLFEDKNRDWHHKMIAFVNKRRSGLLKRLSSNGFKEEYFYAPEKSDFRKDCLFYRFVYGNEEKLAGTGLREAQFKDVFTSKQFEDILFYIYPKYKQQEYGWNFENKEEYLNFCKGLFAFDVRSFREAMPIRLANYFYPEHFLPIFNLTHLKEICLILKYECNSKDRAVQLFEYNQFLKDRLKDVPFNNFIKSNILYKLLYTIKVKRELEKNNSESIHEFITKQGKEWVRNNMLEGLKLIQKNSNKQEESTNN